VRTIVKRSTQIALAGLVALAFSACVIFESKFSDVVGPDIAAISADAACVGAPEFAEAALEGLSPAVAAIVASGIEASCASRPDRRTISAVTYANPVKQFCADTSALEKGDADFTTRSVFNARRAEICTGASG